MASIPADHGVAGIVDLDLEAEVRQLEDKEVIEYYLVLQGEVLSAPPQYDMLIELLDLNPPVAGRVHREIDDAWKPDVYPSLHHWQKSLGDDEHGYIISVPDHHVEPMWHRYYYLMPI